MHPAAALSSRNDLALRVALCGAARSQPGGAPARQDQVHRLSPGHRGVLFLDEAEFGPRSLEALRTPLEDGEIRLARRDGHPSDDHLLPRAHDARISRLHLSPRSRGPRISKRLRYHFTLTLRAATSTAHSIYPHPPGCPQTRLREVDLVPRARQPHG
ncbi:MAG TPA: ATP-binding protein [Pseudonocardiaceae bacterium]